MSPPPVLETERLLLRAHRVDDFDDCYAMWSDPVVTRFIGGKPATREETWARLLRYAGHWTLLGFGYWVITDKGSGRFLGDLGFADFHRDIEPGFGGAPEIGWALAPHAHGRGIATEAVTAALTWGERTWPGQRTVCIISPDNLPSIRVAQKCGFREVTKTTYKGSPTVLFERIPTRSR